MCESVWHSKPTCKTLGHLHLESDTQFWSQYLKKDIVDLQKAGRKAIAIKGMERFLRRDWKDQNSSVWKASIVWGTVV